MKIKSVMLSDIVKNKNLSLNPKDYMETSYRDKVEALREDLIEKVQAFFDDREKNNCSTYLNFNSAFNVYISQYEGNSRYVQVPRSRNGSRPNASSIYLVNAIYKDGSSIMLDTEEVDISIFTLHIHEVAYIYDMLIENNFEEEDEGPLYDGAGYTREDR